jgi:hypothetical protein
MLSDSPLEPRADREPRPAGREPSPENSAERLAPRRESNAECSFAIAIGSRYRVCCAERQLQPQHLEPQHLEPTPTSEVQGRERRTGNLEHRTPSRARRADRQELQFPIRQIGEAAHIWSPAATFPACQVPTPPTPPLPCLTGHQKTCIVRRRGEAAPLVGNIQG